ncbi:MAG: flagellar basal body P-ring formation protein FlgA [Deltaproteobacteria bacterium]|nr:flagellar basal body P-ring formation protein FlgA [Deltaproteobacteria bacterium]
MSLKSGLTRSLVFSLILAILLACRLTAGQAADLSVMVKSKAHVRGAKIFLKDIAFITGPDCALKRDIGLVFITKAPKPGQSIKIRQDYLTHRLRASSLPLDRFEWSLPQLVTVSREYQTITAEILKKIFKDYLSANDPYRSSDWELVSLRAGTLPRLPAGRLTYKIISHPTPNPTYLSLTIYCFVDNKEAAHVRVAGRINLFCQAVVAARTIERGEVIRAKDIKTARVNLARLRQAAINSPAEVIGKANRRRRLHPGQPILARDLSKQPVVKKGDTLTIMVESGTLRITTLGKAKQDGAAGEKIPVLNLRSKKVVMARILGPNLARIDF